MGGFILTLFRIFSLKLHFWAEPFACIAGRCCPQDTSNNPLASTTRVAFILVLVFKVGHWMGIKRREMVDTKDPYLESQAVDLPTPSHNPQVLWFGVRKLSTIKSASAHLVTMLCWYKLLVLQPNCAAQKAWVAYANSICPHSQLYENAKKLFLEGRFSECVQVVSGEDSLVAESPKVWNYLMRLRAVVSVFWNVLLL